MTKLPADMYKIGIKWHTMLEALILALTKHWQFKIIKILFLVLENESKAIADKRISQYIFWYWHQIAFAVDKVQAFIL